MNRLPHPSEDDLEGDADDWEHGEDGEAELPVDGQEQDAGAEDEEHRRHDRPHRLGNEHLHGVDVRRQVGEEHRAPDAVDVGQVLGRQLRDNLCPQVARDALGRIHLRDVLEVAEDKDSDCDDEEFDDERTDNQLAGGEGIDRARNDFRNEQVQRVGGDREADDRGDKGNVRLQQSHQCQRRAGFPWPAGAGDVPGVAPGANAPAVAETAPVWVDGAVLFSSAFEDMVRG